MTTRKSQTGWLGTQEVLDLLKVDRSTLMSMRAKRLIRATQLGRSPNAPYRWVEADVRKIIENPPERMSL